MQDPKNVTLLIVDDDENLRKALIFDFKRNGFNVLDASNGKDAIEIVKQNKIDVIISDIRMSNGDGIELLDNVKTKNVDVPVVLLITGFADISEENAYDKGADAIFSKPFNRKELLQAVLDAITPKGDLWSRSSERTSEDFEITLQFSELMPKSGDKVVNIGRGGMFVAIKNNLPLVGSSAAFNISFQSGPIREITGTGVIRWIRAKKSEHCLTGCGIEFKHLSDGCRKSAIAVIQSLKMKPFIPKQ